MLLLPPHATSERAVKGERAAAPRRPGGGGPARRSAGAAGRTFGGRPRWARDGWPWAGTAPAGGERGRGARKSGTGFVLRGDAALGAAGGRRRSARAAAAGPALRGAEPGGRPYVARGLCRGPACGPTAPGTDPRGLLARGVGPFELCGILCRLRIDAGS